MKTTNKILITALALGGVLFAQSCQEKPLEPEKVEPVFPDLIEKTITKGQETTVFKFQPNLDWKVEVTGEGAGTSFWIDDAGMKETSIKGLANKDAEFSVVFSDETLFDVILECQVKMTMGNVTQLIGTLVKSPIARTLNFKVALVDDFMFSSKYEKADKVDLVTFEEVKTYERPVSIMANYEWDLAVPDWCACYVSGELVEGSIHGEANQEVKCTLNGILTADIKDGAEGKLVISDKNNSEEIVEIPVTLPSFAGKMHFGDVNFTEFTADGLLKMGMGGAQEGSAFAYGFATDEIVVKAFSKKPGAAFYDTNFPTYLTWVNEPDANNTTENPIKSFILSFNMEPNTEAVVRTVDVLAFPAAMLEGIDASTTDSFLTTEGDAFNPKFAPYHLATFTQDAAENVEPEGEALFTVAAGNATIARMTVDDEKYAALSQKFGTTQLYKMVTKDAATILNYAGKTDDVWSFPFYEASDPYGMLMEVFSSEGFMGAQLPVYYVGAETETYAEGVMVLQGEMAKTLAAVYVVYDTEAALGGDDYISPASGRAEVRKLQMGDAMYLKLNGEFPDCTEIYEVVASDKEVILSYNGPEIWSAPCFKAEPPYSTEITDDSVYFDPQLMAVTTIKCIVGESITSKTEAVVKILGENNSLLALVHFIYQPSEAGVVAPFSFAFTPQTDATLEPVTGTELAAIKSEFSGVKDENVYKLTYNAEWPPMCFVNFPGAPFSLIGWNCAYEDVQWLQAEDAGQGVANQYSVIMSEVGKTDYFVWKAADGMFTHVLVCTRTK